MFSYDTKTLILDIVDFRQVIYIVKTVSENSRID